MSILRQLLSDTGVVVALLILWMGIEYLPKLKRVAPDTRYHDMRGVIPTDATVSVDATVGLREMRQGDLMAYRIPDEMETGFGWVVGLPGQRVELVDGELRVDGEAVTDGRVRATQGDRPPVVVPEDHIYTVSQENFFDSLGLGPIPASLVLGRVGGL